MFRKISLKYDIPFYELISRFECQINVSSKRKMKSRLVGKGVTECNKKIKECDKMHGEYLLGYNGKEEVQYIMF